MKRIFSGLLICLTMILPATQAQEFAGINPEHLPSGSFNFSNPVISSIELPSKLVLEYAEQGNPDGIPVILLHGFADSWHSYEMIMLQLPASLHIYSISQRGHGNSSKPLQGYYPDDFANDIAAFIQLMGIKDPILVGHSMGSTVVQRFVSSNPSVARGIILTGAFADYDRPALIDFKKIIDQLTDPVDTMFTAEFQKMTVYRPVPISMMKLFIEESGKLPAYVWKGVAASWNIGGYTNQLKNYKNPALLIWGDKDILTSKKDQEMLQESLPKSNLKIYEGTGHATHWEEPERFAKDILEFIESLR